MFGFHFAIYGEMLLKGFSKKKPAFVALVTDYSVTLIGVDFFLAKKSTPFIPLMPFVFTL